MITRSLLHLPRLKRLRIFLGPFLFLLCASLSSFDSVRKLYGPLQPAECGLQPPNQGLTPLLVPEQQHKQISHSNGLCACFCVNQKEVTSQVSFNCHLEESFTEELFRAGWPVGMSWGGVHCSLKWEAPTHCGWHHSLGKRELTVGSYPKANKRRCVCSLCS